MRRVLYIKVKLARKWSLFFTLNLFFFSPKETREREGQNRGEPLLCEFLCLCDGMKLSRDLKYYEEQWLLPSHIFVCFTYNN